jgi:hypothetical protein
MTHWRLSRKKKTIRQTNIFFVPSSSAVKFSHIRFIFYSFIPTQNPRFVSKMRNWCRFNSLYPIRPILLLSRSVQRRENLPVHFGPTSTGEIKVETGRASRASVRLHTLECRPVFQKIPKGHVTHVPFTPSVRNKPHIRPWGWGVGSRSPISETDLPQGHVPGYTPPADVTVAAQASGREEKELCIIIFFQVYCHFTVPYASLLPK